MLLYVFIDKYSLCWIMKACNLNSTGAHVDLVVNFQLDLVILILYVCFYINIHLVILIYEIL